MPTEISQKVEFEQELTLQDTGIWGQKKGLTNSRLYLEAYIPDWIKGDLGKMAIKNDHKPGERVKYRITIELAN